MLFAFICFDQPGKAVLRQEIRAEHIEYMMAVKSRTVFGGPLQDDSGKVAVGSIFAIDFADRAGAAAFIEDEPYTKNGVFSPPQIYPWKQMVPELEEGSLQRELERQKDMASACTS
jgi:uncharacterized protein